MKKFLLKPFSLGQTYEIPPESVVWGSRPRLVVKNKKNNHLYFLKWFTISPRELWVELFASEFGKIMPDISIQEVSIKSLDKGIIKNLQDSYWEVINTPFGVLIRNAFPQWYEITYGYTILGIAPRGKTSLKQVWDAINKKYWWMWWQSELLQAYSDMLIFDILIGNMDRHLENWGVLESEEFRSLQMRIEPKKVLKWSVTFSPLFDHGSAWLFELTDEKVEYYLQHPDEFKKHYILSHDSMLLTMDDGSCKDIFCLLKHQIDHDCWWKKYLKTSIKRISNLNELDIAKVIFKMPNVPDLEYSEKRQELLFRAIGIRRQLLLSLF
jgi:hypothetical protein